MRNSNVLEVPVNHNQWSPR